MFVPDSLTWTPKVCRIIAIYRFLGHYFTYFGGSRQWNHDDMKVCTFVSLVIEKSQVLSRGLRGSMTQRLHVPL